MTGRVELHGWNRPNDTGGHFRTARLGQFLHLKDAPPSLVTRSLRGIDLAVTKSSDNNPVPGLSGSLARRGFLHGRLEAS